MRYLLSPMGSSGDVLPFIGIGRALHHRGHDVIVLSNPHFERVIRDAGLGYSAIGTQQDYERLTSNPDLWHPSKALRTVMIDGVTLVMREQLERIRSLHVAGDTVLVSGSLAVGARVAQEVLNIPAATIHLQPAIFASVVEPPRNLTLFHPKILPTFLRRFYNWFAYRVVIDGLLSKPVNSFRAEHGLPPARNIMRTWWNSPDLAIGMFPAWYAPPQADWPSQAKLADFPLYNAGEGALAEDLVQWLSAGERPVVATPGSAMRHGRDFFRCMIDATERIGRRLVVATGYLEHLPEPLPAHVRHVRYAPFSDLFPRCAAVIHHGGIGTVSQAIRAGIPQLIVPFAHDQPDNADRIKRLGMGDWLAPGRFRPTKVAPLLTRLLSDTGIRKQCEHFASKLTTPVGCELAADMIEALR